LLEMVESKSHEIVLHQGCSISKHDFFNKRYL
jgi:hypothetical protein